MIGMTLFADKVLSPCWIQHPELRLARVKSCLSRVTVQASRELCNFGGQDCRSIPQIRLLRNIWKTQQGFRTRMASADPTKFRQAAGRDTPCGHQSWRSHVAAMVQTAKTRIAGFPFLFLLCVVCVCLLLLFFFWGGGLRVAEECTLRCLCLDAALCCAPILHAGRIGHPACQ